MQFSSNCAILLPTHSINSHPCCPEESNVSIAIGTKSFEFKSTYFANFVASADTAAAPATRSVESRCDGATVFGHVKSHAIDISLSSAVTALFHLDVGRQKNTSRLTYSGNSCGMVRVLDDLIHVGVSHVSARASLT